MHDLVIGEELNIQLVNGIISLKIINNIFDKIKPPRKGEEMTYHGDARN